MMYKNNKINSVIGQNILKIRKLRNMKQDAFASELNIALKTKYNISAKYDCKTISKWESGQSIPKMDVLIAIAKEYGLSLDEMLKSEIKDFVSKSSFSASEESILNEFLDNKHVCIKKDGKYISAYNPNLYRYGQLSYLADNMVAYRGELSKNFSFTNPTKEVQIIVGIMDVNDGKRELHYLGNCEDDIVSVEHVPLNCDINIKNNNIISSLMFNEITRNHCQSVIKLGNGKLYVINENPISYNSKDYKFKEGSVPEDLGVYEINAEEYDWTDYACLKGHYIIDDEKLFDFSGSGIYFYKDAGIFEIVLFGNIKCTDEQLIKVLADDYKHRLIRAMEQVSDSAIFENNLQEIEQYIKHIKGES